MKLLRNSLELDKPAELRDHHSLFTLQPARQRRSVALLVLAFHVIPDLAIGAFTVPAEIAVRDGVDGEVLKTAQQAILLRNADFVAHYLETDELLVRIEQIRCTLVQAAALCSLIGSGSIIAPCSNLYM